MILISHSIVGSAVASLFPTHPVLGLSLAFVSHFALDSIPHWDYPIRSASINPDKGGKMELNKTLLIDLLTISIDGLLGLASAYILFHDQPAWVWFLGSAFGMAPDFLQFIYLRFNFTPNTWLQKAHKFIHSETRIKNPIIGIPLQMISVFIVFEFLNLFR